MAGALQSTGGFASPGADSVVAIEEIEDATGRAPTAGVVLVVSTPEGLDAAAPRVDEVAAELAAEDGIVDVVAPNPARAGPGLVSVDGDSALVLGTLSADADDEAVAESIARPVRRSRRRGRGRSGDRQLPDRRARSARTSAAPRCSPSRC